MKTLASAAAATAVSLLGAQPVYAGGPNYFNVPAQWWILLIVILLIVNLICCWSRRR